MADECEYCEEPLIYFEEDGKYIAKTIIDTNIRQFAQTAIVREEHGEVYVTTFHMDGTELSRFYPKHCPICGRYLRENESRWKE